MGGLNGLDAGRRVVLREVVYNDDLVALVRIGVSLDGLKAGRDVRFLVAGCHYDRHEGRLAGPVAGSRLPPYALKAEGEKPDQTCIKQRQRSQQDGDKKEHQIFQVLPERRHTD